MHDVEAENLSKLGAHRRFAEFKFAKHHERSKEHIVYRLGKITRIHIYS